jgi:hypothetical protein
LLKSTSENESNLPVVLPRETSSGAEYSECLIRGKSQRGGLVRLLAIFESRGIRVVSCSYESSDRNSAFGATLVLELKNSSDSQTLTLVEKLMDTRIVSSIEFAPLEGRSFNIFRFPIVILPEERGVIVQPELLIDGIQNAIEEQSKSILEAGRNYGRALASRLHQSNGTEKSLGIIVQTLKATGWGIGKFEENENGEVLFTLGDPAFGINSEMKMRSRFLVGMIQGMVEGVHGCNMRLLSDRFDGKSNSVVVRLSK